MVLLRLSSKPLCFFCLFVLIQLPFIALEIKNAGPWDLMQVSNFNKCTFLVGGYNLVIKLLHNNH
jgi:hypothetical protein